MIALSPVESIHLATVAPAAAIGVVLLAGRKGTTNHRALGRVYLVLMFATVPAAWWAARTGRISAHRGMMVGLFIGAILIAGSLTLVPGRFLGSLVWG